MKIACFPDIHCYWGSYEKNSKGAVPSRLIEWRETTDEAIKIAQKFDCRIAILPGDFFRDSRPTPEMILEVSTFIRRLRSFTSVLGCCGNHDFISAGTSNAVDVIGSYFGSAAAATQITAFRFASNIGAVIVPYGALTDDIYDKLDELKREKNISEGILISHYATDRSIYVNDAHASEPGFSTDMLKALNFRACVLGHIHKPQIINTKPLIFHTGTLTRNKSDEGEIPCGITILDSDTWTTEFVELKSPRKIITLKLENPFDPEPFDPEAVNGQIVVVKYDVEEDVAAKVDLHNYKQSLMDAGASFIADIKANVIRKEREQVSDVSESISDTEKFRRWASENMGVELDQYQLEVFEQFMKDAKEN